MSARKALAFWVVVLAAFMVFSMIPAAKSVPEGAVVAIGVGIAVAFWLISSRKRPSA